MNKGRILFILVAFAVSSFFMMWSNESEVAHEHSESELPKIIPKNTPNIPIATIPSETKYIETVKPTEKATEEIKPTLEVIIPKSTYVVTESPPEIASFSKHTKVILIYSDWRVNGFYKTWSDRPIAIVGFNDDELQALLNVLLVAKVKSQITEEITSDWKASALFIKWKNIPGQTSLSNLLSYLEPKIDNTIFVITKKIPEKNKKIWGVDTTGSDFGEIFKFGDKHRRWNLEFLNVLSTDSGYIWVEQNFLSSFPSSSTDMYLFKGLKNLFYFYINL